MASADLVSGRIRVTGDSFDLRYINRTPGAKRQLDGSWSLPLTLDSCLALIDQGIVMSETLKAEYLRLDRILRYTEHIKTQTEPVEPLQAIPIKEPFHLYQHQIKAYNIALALFGRGARKKES